MPNIKFDDVCLAHIASKLSACLKERANTAINLHILNTQFVCMYSHSLSLSSPLSLSLSLSLSHIHSLIFLVPRPS